MACILQHCAGVESLALSPDGSTLFTASRDATVCSWSAEGSDCGQWQASFEGHSNWVNDVVTVDDALVSCSSDCTVSVWKANASGPLSLAALEIGHVFISRAFREQSMQSLFGNAQHRRSLREWSRCGTACP